MTDPLTPAQRQMVADNLGLCGWAVNRWCRNLPIDGNGYTRPPHKSDAAKAETARLARLSAEVVGKPYSCEVCGKGFATPGGVDVHVGMKHRAA